jgi:polysaccharide biosynthesis transport protein
MTMMPKANDGFAMPMADEGDNQDNVRVFSLVELWAAIYRSRVPIIAILVATQVIAIGYSLLATRYYRSTTLVEIRQEAEKVLGTEADREGTSSKLDADRFLQTQLDIIRSRSTSNAVAESLRLYRGNGFLETMRVTKEPDGRGVLSEVEAKRQQILNVLEANLSVNYTGDTRLAGISFSCPDPRMAAQIANAYAENYIRNNLARKLDSSSYALQFLRDQLSEAQARLEQSEQSAVNYARQTRIVDASNAATTKGTVTQPQSLVTAQLVQLNEALSVATAERIQAEQKWGQTAALPIMNIPEVLTNQAIQGMVQRKAEAEAAYREQLSSRQESYPSVIQAKAGVSTLDSQINSLARSIRGSIRNQYDVARQRERQLLSTLDSLKNRTLSEQKQSIQLSILRRGAETNRAQYDALLQRFNQLNAESGVQTNNLSIVDKGQVPVVPAWPKLPLNIALAGMFGLLLSAGLLIIRVQLFDAIRTPADVSDRLNLALLGTVPNEADIAMQLTDSKSAASEAFSSIRTSLSLAGENGTPRTILFTSAQQGEGKSSTCHALALSFARLGKHVLIMDVDMRRPNAHRLFDIENKKGLSNFLGGQCALADVIHTTRVPNVDLITVGDIPPNPIELLSSQNFDAIVEKMKHTYDVILMDSAPILGLADAIVLSANVEATVLVVEAGRNTVRGAKSALDRIQRGGAHIVGTVLTKFDAAQFGYSYGAYYGYNYEYSSGQDKK